MGGFYDFYREQERRANTTERVSVEGGPVIWDERWISTSKRLPAPPAPSAPGAEPEPQQEVA